MYARPLQRFHFRCYTATARSFSWLLCPAQSRSENASCVLPQVLLFGLQWLKSSEQHEQVRIVGVLRLRAAQAPWHTIDLRGAPLRMSTFWRGLRTCGRVQKKREKIEKVT